MLVLHFLPLFFWMLGFYALHLFAPVGAQILKDRAGAVFGAWLLGTALFLLVGLLLTLRTA